jgi:uncharacterized membrane protein
VIVMVAAIIPLVLGLATIVDSPVIGAPLIAVAVFIIALGTVVNSAVSQLFRFVLYEYSVSDRALGSFGADELDAAFKPRRRFLGF